MIACVQSLSKHGAFAVSLPFSAGEAQTGMNFLNMNADCFGIKLGKGESSVGMGCVPVNWGLGWGFIA